MHISQSGVPILNRNETDTLLKKARQSLWPSKKETFLNHIENLLEQAIDVYEQNQSEEERRTFVRQHRIKKQTMELHIDEEKVVQIVNSAIDSFKDGHLDGLKEEVQQLKQKKHELLCETEKQAEVRKNVENDINELKNNRMALQVEIIKLKEDKKNLKSNVEHLNEDIKKLLEKRKAIQEENRKIEEYLPEIKELLRLQKVADKTNGDYHKFRGIDNNYEWAAYSSLYEFLYEKFKKEIQRHNQDGSLFDYLTDRI